MLCDDLETWDKEVKREVQKGGDMGIYICIRLISLCCTTETNTVLLSNYTPIKIYLKKE